jgi:potassium efflux system protein
LLIGLRLINDVLIRWFNVAERRSRLEAALRQREEARSEREQPEEEGISGFEIEVPEIDYRELGEQARTVIRVGVFLGLILSVGTIWGDLVPTFGLLERVELPFSKLQLVDGIEQQLPVNLADLIIALLILAGTLFAAHNLSGLLEFTILRRLHLDTGGNYAIVTLCQYVIVAIGVVAAFSTIGFQWSKIQWLVAALGVGLGFGLQEIVANFVSGIILLLERPVRIGDIVTVGTADGFISRIRIRATTILTWEKKELIIPNKEFITGQVINWTLTDSLNRILLNVGIAYGSDVRKALELMKEAATENEHVVADPEPMVTFEAFGNDALMLYLRCYIASLDYRLVTVTALHQAIYDKFIQAGIVIAFPQRDVHLDTSKPLEVKVHRSPAAHDPQ